MAASSSAALRDKPQSPRNGRDGARPSTENPMEGHGPSWPRKTAPNGGPCSVMAASSSAALRDKPQDPKNGRDGARPSRGHPAQKTDATERVPPRKGPDPPLEGHGPSWPQSQTTRPKDGRDGARPSRDGREGQTADKAGPDSPRVRLQNRCRDPVRWSLGADSSSLAASCLKLRLDAASG